MRIRPSRGALGRVLVGLLLWGLLFVYGGLPHPGFAQSAFALSPTQKSPPMMPVIEVSEKQDCPSERRVVLGEVKNTLYLDAHAICKSASKPLVAVVMDVRVDGKSRECSGLALRERKDSRKLKWGKQSVGRGTVLCQGDVLVTWRGVEVSYVTFKSMLGPNGKPTKQWTTGEAGSLGELGRLALGSKDSTLMSGRLNYFYDPDYPEHTIALGIGGPKAGGAGTFVSMEVTDACRADGTVGVPAQAPGAKGEVHQVKVCLEVPGAGVQCSDPIQEGKAKRVTTTADVLEVNPAVGADFLAAARIGYEEEVASLKAEKIPVPIKDNDYVPPPPSGMLKLRVTPSASQVWLDGERLRVKVGEDIPVLPGPHVLLGQSPSGKRQDMDFEAVSGQPVSVSLDLEPGASGIEFLPVPGTGPDGFWMGSKEGEGYDYERPRHQVVVQPFQLSKTEVTVAQYKACVDEGKCTKPDTGGECNWEVAGREQHPINCVDWGQAKAYATWLTSVVGGQVRLPSEAEWEYAARGKEERKYPWGPSEPTDELANYGSKVGGTTKVGAYPKGASWVGALDMAGNVWEWVEDCWHDSYSNAPEDGSPWTTSCSSSAPRVIRGGSWFFDPVGLRGANRFRILAGDWFRDGGFRVVLASGPGGEH